MQSTGTVSSRLDAAHLAMLDDLTSAVLRSIDVQDRVDAILRFMVPSVADGASVVLQEYNGEERSVTRGRMGAEALVMPLHLDRRRIGLLRLSYGHRTPLPRVLHERLAERIARALSDALMFEREQRAALAFQFVAMDPALPALPGYALDAVYEAGSSEALVGGDWYDAFVLRDGRLIVSIGDVVGSGLRAAVAMVNVRQSLRTVAQIYPDPILMLEAANRTLLEEFPDRFVTTFIALIDPVTQICTFTSAGHPPPFLRLPDGGVVQLPSGGVPLGVPQFTENLRVQHMTLAPGSVLVLYTDGLTEATRDMLEGEGAVLAATAALDPSAQRAATTIYRSVIPLRARDDVAVLTVSVRQQVELPRWRFDPRWGDLAGRARAEMSLVLAQNGFAEQDVFVFQVIFAELVANIMRHADGLAEFLLQVQDDAFILHALDKGFGFQFTPRLPSDLFSEGGRGLYLISKLAQTFTVDRRPGGGSHARVVVSRSKGTVI